jgi:Zn-dependent protease
LTPVGATATFRADRYCRLLLASFERGIRAPGQPASPRRRLQYQELLLVVPVLLFSIIAHEIAHGYAALKQGDDTALMLGRLTWNPIKHIDPFMTVILPIVLALAHAPILGGAKPVPVNPRKYRNFKRGDIIVSLAGVFVNLLIAIGCVVLLAVFGGLGRVVPALGTTFGIAQAMMIVGVQLNMVLIAFNLIPIPPLDGSHVMKYLLPPAWALKYMQFGRIGVFALIAVMYLVPNALEIWLGPALTAGGAMINVVYGTILPSARPLVGIP